MMSDDIEEWCMMSDESGRETRLMKREGCVVVGMEMIMVMMVTVVRMTIAVVRW